jgi:hypothetical protein
MPKECRLGLSADGREELGDLGDSEGQAVKAMIVCEIAEAMRIRPLSQASLVVLAKTSWSQLGLLLVPAIDVIRSTLGRIAAIVGRKLPAEFVSTPVCLAVGARRQVPLAQAQAQFGHSSRRCAAAAPCNS